MTTIFDTIRMIWSLLTGKAVLTADITKAEQRIVYWQDIYRGEPAWLKYTWLGISGHKQERVRECMGFAKLACAELARLVWAENPKIDTDDDILAFFDREDFYNRSAKLTEYGAALGAFAWKLYSPVSDGEPANLKIDFVTADFIIPRTVENETITEADFISKFVRDEKSYYRIESHRRIPGGYRITNEIRDVSGAIAPMVSPEKFGFASSVDITVSVPTFVYVPTPEANNLDIHSGLGISCFANATGTLKSLDTAFDSLQHEIVMGIRKIIVPASCTRTYINTETGKQEIYYDPSDEVFIAFNDTEKLDLKITDNTPELRIDQLRLAISTLINIACNQIGFSQGSFSFDGVSMKTATEVISEDSKTFKTTKAYQNQIGRGIEQLILAIKEIGGAYGIKSTTKSTVVAWDDSIIEDRAAKEKRINDRVTAGTMTKYQAIMELDGVDEATARTRADEIKKDNATIDVPPFV